MLSSSGHVEPNARGSNLPLLIRHVRAFQGILTTAGSPPEIVARLSEELRKILAQPDVQQKIAEQGGEVHSGKAEDLKAWLTENTKAYAEIIKAAGVKIE